MRGSREITEVIADVVKAASDCTIAIPDFRYGRHTEMKCPPINYIFGNSNYIKEQLDVLSRTPRGNEMKFPLIALFCPFVEQRDSAKYYTKAKIHLLIACSTSKEWSNEERRETSFVNVLRPIYRRFIEALKEDGRIDIAYDEVIPHQYTENYTYGKYGALTDTGEEVSEPIDAINITNLEITIKKQNCR